MKGVVARSRVRQSELKEHAAESEFGDIAVEHTTSVGVRTDWRVSASVELQATLIIWQLLRKVGHHEIACCEASCRLQSDRLAQKCDFRQLTMRILLLSTLVVSVRMGRCSKGKISKQ